MGKRYVLFTTPSCPNCPTVKTFMMESGLIGELVDASKPEGLQKARDLNVAAVPTVIFFDGDLEVGRARSVDEAKAMIESEGEG